MTDDTPLTGDPRTPDEILEDEARAIKDELPEVNPDAATWPADVRTERIDPGEDDPATTEEPPTDPEGD